MIQDHQPIRVNNFNGLFGIDSYEDSVPPDHFIDAINTISSGNEIKTRDGVDLEIDFPGILRQYRWRIQGQASRKIVLDNFGKIFDLTISSVNPILSIPGMLDFDAIAFNNRLFITPSNGKVGLPGEYIYVYSGSGVARKAAGNAPSTGFTVSLSSTEGHVEEGLHIFAWVFETDSGFVTPPGPAVFQTISTDGTKKLNFSNIPVGPAGTAKRRLIGTRAIQDYNGDQDAYEMFFVPNGNMTNNVDTFLNDIDFYDVDLQLSADYAFDQLSQIPACLFLSQYGRRLVAGNTNFDKHIVYISKDNEPESINALAGFQSFDPFETEGVKNATEFRGSLFVRKLNKTYTGTDNGYEPSTWKFQTLDGSIGCDFNGAAKYIDVSGGKSDFLLVADRSGLFKFTGVYEEIPTSYKIKNWWNRITKSQFHKLHILLDPDKFLIYIAVPLDGVNSPNYIIVGDYEAGLDPIKIKWHLWNFTDFSPTSLAIDINNITMESILKIASLNGNIYEVEPDRRNDNNTLIRTTMKFALLYQSSNAIHHVGAIGLRCKGSGTVGITLRGEDKIDTQVLVGMTLVNVPGKEFIRQSTFQSEKCSIELNMSSVNGWISLWQVNLYTNIIYLTRPGV